MSAFEALQQAIGQNPYDDAPRLVAADWLEEQGDLDRAAFIRLQCELEPNRDKYELAGVEEMHDREKAFLKHYEKQWLGEMPEGWDHWRSGLTIQFRRGFPDVLALPARTFLELGPQICSLHPTLRRLVLFRLADYGEPIAGCDAISHFSELELACWYPDADAEALAASPYLKRLKHLVYWLADADPNVWQCEQLASACQTTWPDLREFVLLDAYPTRGNKQSIVTRSNEAAGREVAVHKVAFPGLIPFAADFWYAFPGHLPDGRAAMGIEDGTTTPPTLCVITFDQRGRQTKDVMRVPMPDVALKADPRDWYLHKEVMQQQLVDELGLTPGFIRICDCEFPNDVHSYNRPDINMFEEFGHPDTDDEDSWNQLPEGYGGKAWSDLDNGEWVFGWDLYGDKTGRIHST